MGKKKIVTSRRVLVKISEKQVLCRPHEHLEHKMEYR
jgi:hypothetical protein